MRRVAHRLLVVSILTWACLAATPDRVDAETCTDGVDCYCDRVQGGDLHDSSLLMCEDFEAPTLHPANAAEAQTYEGNGAPLFGPWYDEAVPGGRGSNSYWVQTYSFGAGNCSWTQGQPTSPQLGSTCNFGQCGLAEWRADDLWQGNSQACIDIVQNGEFDDEIPTLLAPELPSGGSGVFDGQRALAHRIQAGDTAAIGGAKTWGTPRFELGITMAMAYPTNSEASGIWAAPWKHNEWHPTNDGIFLFHQGGLDETDPFEMFTFGDPGAGFTAASCSANASASVIRGTWNCNSIALNYQADPAYYRRSTDWPWGTWACVRGHFTGLNTTNMGIRIWFNDTLVVHFQGFDGTILKSRDGYDGLTWNSYANTNQGDIGSTPTNQTTYRYEDNIHIREGAPVSCDQIGLGAGGSATGPLSGLFVQDHAWLAIPVVLEGIRHLNTLTEFGKQLYTGAVAVIVRARTVAVLSGVAVVYYVILLAYYLRRRRWQPEKLEYQPMETLDTHVIREREKVER